MRHPSPLTMKHRRFRFTLIEMLVVVTVIVILIGMLLPGLQSAKEKAKEIACLSNLRQNGIALFSYQIDHDAYYVGSSWGSLSHFYIGEVPGSVSKPLYDSYGFVAPSVGGNQYIPDNAGGTLDCPSNSDWTAFYWNGSSQGSYLSLNYVYVGGHGNWFSNAPAPYTDCDGYRYSDHPFIPGVFSEGWYGYVCTYQGNHDWPDTSRPVPRLTMVSNPASVMIMQDWFRPLPEMFKFEYMYKQRGLYAGTYGLSMDAWPNHPLPNDPLISKFANNLMVDGHVKKVFREDATYKFSSYWNRVYY